MGAKSEALARKFEAKVQEATAVIERLREPDWKKTTEGEKWPVGVVAHHIATGHEMIAGIIRAVAGGQSPSVSLDTLHATNARHAAEHAGCTKTETLALHRKNAAAAAAVVRGLTDEELGASGTVLTGQPPMTTEQLAGGLLIGHIDEHLSSIRAAVGA